MKQAEQTLFTVGVFKDVIWAERGVEALRQQGFQPAVMTVMVKDGPEAASFVQKVTGNAPEHFELPNIGATLGAGTLVGALQGGARDLGRVGIAAAMRRAGFQPHDGLIYETLTERGGVLVAIEDPARASDALTVLLSFGGGNAAIGAWAGRI
ncbi:MAG: hypothetical protein WCP29_16140 [Acidobacteriota bacterium]